MISSSSRQINLQEKILIGSTNWISIVNLIDFYSFRYCAHYKFPDDLERELWRIKLIDDWNRLTGNTLLHYLWYNWGCRRTVEGFLSQGMHAQTC